MSGRYISYPSYRESEHPRLGKLPDNWRVHQLKRAVEGCVNGIWGGEPTGGSDDIVVLRVADFDRPRLRVAAGDYTLRSVTKNERGRRLLSPGDLLLEKSGGGEKTLVGQVVLFDGDFDAVCSNFVAKMTPLSGYDSGYLNYVFSSLYADGINSCSIKQNTGIQNLDSNAYLAEHWAFPPLDQQTQIARFLDYETAKIDALVAKQQQLIALLQEKRQAVISHAVTKGLNPAAPLRDSGVEWLGQVPAHWRSSKLRWYCISIRDGTHTPPPRAEGVHRLLSVRNIINGHFVLRDDDRTMTPNAFLDLQRSYTVEPGDVLLAIVGGTTGKSAVAPKLENVTVQRSLAIIRPQRAELNSYFLNYWIQSNLLQGKIQEIAIKYAAQPGIYLDDVAGLVVPIPPITEQHEIVEFLDKRTDKLEVLITKAERAIELLQERRTALIAAAVTGKIDVRGWQPPVATPAAGFDEPHGAKATVLASDAG